MTGAATAVPTGLSWEQFVELLDRDEYRSAELIDSTRALDLARLRHAHRAADYARIGVGELWLVDPEGPAALVLRREGALTSPQLPELAVVIGGLLER